MSGPSNSRRNFLRQLSCTMCAGGASAFIPQLNLISSALAQGSVPGYKALVCVYLAGGNDAWNMLIPYDTARHATYVTSRSGVYNATTNPGGLAIDRAALAGTTLTGNQYALHPAMTDLRALYNSGRLALLPNIGPLKQPITKAQYNSTPSLRPPQLYSHNDQEEFWHLGRTASFNRGWGGQVADRVRGENVYQTLSPCISIGGSNRFEIGAQTFPYQMSSGGVTALNNIGGPTSTGSDFQRYLALEQMLDAAYTSPYQQEYANILGRSRELYFKLRDGLAAGGVGNVTTTFPANNSLGDQLKMVARMIKLSKTLGSDIEHKRQVYYVRIGGFDLHDNLITNNGHFNLLQRVSQALNAFWTALNEPGLNARNEVTTFTMSEFARTLTTNGNGSDHAWGSVQMVLGGKVQGGQLYGTFPDQTLNGPLSFSRGQTIPTTSVDQMAATLARWMGVTSTTELNTIFPNLPNFASNDLGFMLP